MSSKQSAKQILVIARKHSIKNGMSSIGAVGYDKLEERIDYCPRGIIQAITKDISYSVFDTPPDRSAAKALKAMDEAGKLLGAEPAIAGPGEYAEGYFQKESNQSTEGIERFFDEALALVKR